MKLLKDTLKVLSVLVAIFMVTFGLGSWVQRSAISQTSPVSVRMIWPTNGTTVSGKITLSADANSLAGPIQRVEFYEAFATTNGGVVTWTTNLIGVVTNRFTEPANLTVY